MFAFTSYLPDSIGDSCFRHTGPSLYHQVPETQPEPSPGRLHLVHFPSHFLCTVLFPSPSYSAFFDHFSLQPNTSNGLLHKL